MTEPSSDWLTTGLYWHQNTAALASARADGTLHEQPVTPGADFTWQAAPPRRCVGQWHPTTRRQIHCPHRQPLADAAAPQCAACAAADPGRALAQDRAADDARDFILYLAWFGSDLFKVGITAANRGTDRLAEQGAIAFTGLARGPLNHIRTAEHRAALAGLARERISWSAKIAQWWALPDTVDNGTAGRTRFGGLDNFRRLCADTATTLTHHVLPHADPLLIIAFDVPFLGLTPYLPAHAARHVVLVPRATARLHDPTNHERIAWEQYGMAHATHHGARIGYISTHMRNHLHHNYAVPEHALTDLRDGLVSDDTYQPAPWPALPPAAANGFLLAMGRAEPYKGFDDLLDALHLLSDTNLQVPPLVLAAVTDTQEPTAYQRHLIERAATLPTPAITLTRYDPGIRALLWHPALRGVIVPSRAEPLGRIPLDAYAADAAPLIATTAGGLAETVIDNTTGYAAKPHDPTSLANALHRALTATPAELVRHRTAGRSLLQHSHNYPKTVARFLARHARGLTPTP